MKYVVQTPAGNRAGSLSNEDESVGLQGLAHRKASSSSSCDVGLTTLSPPTPLAWPVKST